MLCTDRFFKLTHIHYLKVKLFYIIKNNFKNTDLEKNIYFSRCLCPSDNRRQDYG